MATIVKELPPETREFLHSFLKASCIDGKCYAFAIALYRGLGWPMVGLMLGEVIRHAGVRDPEGRFWDARGAVTEEKIGEPFGLKPPYDIRPITEQNLFSVKPIHDFEIEHVILKKAQVLWPKLPWKIKTRRERVRDFVKDLEKLSREHGLWIYGNFPTALPAIAEGEGDETGYKVIADATGLNYFFNRVIGG
jgi:hypothetical protein